MEPEEVMNPCGKTGKSEGVPGPPASVPSEGCKFTTHPLVALVACLTRLTPGDVAKVSAPRHV